MAQGDAAGMAKMLRVCAKAAYTVVVATAEADGRAMPDWEELRGSDIAREMQKVGLVLRHRRPANLTDSGSRERQDWQLFRRVAAATAARLGYTTLKAVPR